MKRSEILKKFIDHYRDQENLLLCPTWVAYTKDMITLGKLFPELYALRTLEYDSNWWPTYIVGVPDGKAAAKKMRIVKMLEAIEIIKKNEKTN